MTSAKNLALDCRVAVIWIDWYPYHVARFRGMLEALPGQVVGIELVGGIGVHAGLKFREALPEDLQIQTLLPASSWSEAGKGSLAVALWRKLSELHPEVVLVPGYYTLPGIAAALWARVHGAQSVLMSESTASDHARIGWKETLKSFVIRGLFDWAVVGGKRHIDYLAQLGFPSDRVMKFYDVVENNFFSTGTHALRQSDLSTASAELPRTPVFLYVGRLAHEKNVATLLDSWLAYRDQGGLWPLVLVGGGPEAAALQASAHASSHSNDVIFAGLRSSHQLLPFYAAAGCFVLPSTREPWGLVVNEAMAAGLPILASSRCGCADDLVQSGRNGFIFEPEDAIALTALLHTVTSLTEKDRHAMGRASEEMIAPFSPISFGISVRTIADAAQTQGVPARAGGSL